jgi:hypothetical protein
VQLPLSPVANAAARTKTTTPEAFIMIRNAMLGLSLFVLSTASAVAAPVKHHAKAPQLVAEASAPAATDTTAPANVNAPKAKNSKKAAKSKAAKADEAKEIKAPAASTAPSAAPAPATVPAPAPATTPTTTK